MNREEGVVKGRVEGEERSKFPVEETESAPELNPFLVEPVLVKLLKLMDSVSQLKELRKMCQTWDEFNLKELEERAFNGKIKAIDFFGEDKLRTKSEAEGNLIQFMEDTSAIPRLFSSFKFNFPGSWILSKHRKFFSIYPMTFIELAIPINFTQVQIHVLLTKFIKTELWGNLKEITISDLNEEKIELPNCSSLFVPSSGPIRRKLQKLNLKASSQEIFRIIKSDFASGKYTNLTSIGLTYIPSGNLNFPGLDVSILNRLEIGHVGGYGSLPALEFTSGLLNWAGNGMMLKNFAMNINNMTFYMWAEPDHFFEHLRLICSNLSQFFSSQSSTLEDLSFSFSCHLGPIEVPEGADIWCKIHLPIFEVLHTLKLGVNFQLIEANPRRTHAHLLGMTKNLAAHFPKLVNLTLQNEKSLIALKVNSATDESRQLQLKHLEISDISGIWSTSFVGVIGSVEELKCPAGFPGGEILHPWGESLRSLHIYHKNTSSIDLERVKLNYGYFKKLEIFNLMVITKCQIRCGWIRVGSQDIRFDNYLAMFKGATELPLKSITFIIQDWPWLLEFGSSKDMTMVEETKREFIRYFPFPVVFKTKI